MDIIRPWLYIGSYRDTLNVTLLTRNSIGAMLQLAEQVDQPGIVSLYLPVDDFAPISQRHLAQGIEFIRVNKRLTKIILVACGAGINRSSVFSAAALKEEEGLSLFEAYKEVKRLHPESLPHPPVWESLCEYYEEKIPYMKIFRPGML